MVTQEQLKSFFIQKVHLARWMLFIAGGSAIALGSGIAGFSFYEQKTHESQVKVFEQSLVAQEGDISILQAQLASVSASFAALEAKDVVAENRQINQEFTQYQQSLRSLVSAFEELQAMKDEKRKVNVVEPLFGQTLSQLIKRDLVSANRSLASISAVFAQIKAEQQAAVVIPANVAQSNTPPSAGYSRQSVSALDGNYLVDSVAGDLSNTRVIVDTASSGDCGNDCPVLPLADYVSRNGAYAGINGSYFCPASYPSCAGKTNSFDTLLMNKNKTYFNSDNNVYSTVPAVIFLGSSVRFVGQSLEWGRDTGIDSMIANQPLLVSGGNVVFGGDGDPKKGSKGTRSFVANKGNTVYIGVVHGVTVAEMAHVLKAMGMDNALNLDSGGSTALWSGGYKAGPGRNIPNAILFVRK